jgi:hypothetical protein
VLGQGYLLRPAAVVVTTTVTVTPVSAAVGTSSGEQSAVEDFKECSITSPPKVLAMLSTDAKYSLPRSTGERTTKSAGSVIEPERSHPGKPGGDPV